MKASSILLAVFAASLASYSYCTCPTRVSSEADTNNVLARFNKFRSAHPVLKVTHVHQRTNRTDKYTYKITICPKTLDAAVLQIDEKNGKSTVVGRASHATISGGEDWILIFYPDGESYGSHCDTQKRQAWLLVQCELENKPTRLRVIEENRWQNGDKSRTDLCYYMMEVNHNSVCSKIPKKLSGGSIFCIMLNLAVLSTLGMVSIVLIIIVEYDIRLTLVSLVAAYLVFGLLYMRFIAGAKGFEQIPHYNFWREVGNLSADGCDFICRRPNHPANTYKGMADALNIDSSDDEKDDQLLPM